MKNEEAATMTTDFILQPEDEERCERELKRWLECPLTDDERRRLIRPVEIGFRAAFALLSAELRASQERAVILPAKEDDTSRCAGCGRPLKDSREEGCIRGLCVTRPILFPLYSPERAMREAFAFLRQQPGFSNQHPGGEA